MRAVRTAKIGVDSQYCRRARRHFARPCLDWSERRPHLAGALGAGIASGIDIELGTVNLKAARYW
jgi:hypothetical protein